MKELRNKNVKSVFGGIGIASLLCVLMVLMSWSAMVTNSDLNSKTSETVEAYDVEPEGTEISDAEVKATSFEAELLGFNEDYEMLGMRTTHSKTFINDEGNLESVHSYNPLHYENQYGELVDINTAILVGENGYYVEDIFTPVLFNPDPMKGLSINIGEDVIKTGVNPVPVTVYQGETMDIHLAGVSVPFTDVVRVQDHMFSPPTKMIEVGGNSINFPMSSTIDMQYTVSPSEVKQEFVIEKLNKDLRLSLMDQLELVRESDIDAEGYFGMQEMMNLPEGVELWANGQQIMPGSEITVTDSAIDIVDSTSGLTIAYIAAPYSYDNSVDDAKQLLSKEEQLEILEPATKYFVDFESEVLTITTAVNLDWLLSDYTSFPVVIDPTVVGTNTFNSDTTPGNYKVCVTANLDCHTQTDGYFRYDYPSWGPHHGESPRFDFTFAQTTPLTIASVNAVYEVSRTQYTGSNDYAGLLIMEQCGSYDVASAYSNGGTSINSIYSPSDCTGTPLADYPAPPAPPAPPVTHVFDNFDEWENCEEENNVYGSAASPIPTTGTSPYQYSITSDMTQCDDGNAAGTLSSVDFVSETTTYENNGIFDAGDYLYKVTDSIGANGDGLDGGASVVFQLRAAGSTDNSAWVDEVEVCEGFSCDHGQDNNNDYPLTVPSGQEMRIAYNCPGTSSCYPGENAAEIRQATLPPQLPGAAATGVSGSPTGSEAATVTFTVLTNEEAYFEFKTGSNPGDADQVEIYYRLSGSTGWSTYWDLYCYSCIQPTMSSTDYFYLRGFSPDSDSRNLGSSSMGYKR